jgi:MoaA/NifB/PqqE/SkfB family radical SAM enzyme
MAHDVLYKAGKLRDEVNDGVVDKDKYYSIIPSEVLYADLKTEFGIDNWYQYFNSIIKQVSKYESDMQKELLETNSGNLTIEREVKLQLTVDMLEQLGIYGVTQPFVGIIDLLMYTDEYAYILDYKFSSSRKTQDDFDMNSQLPLYAFMVHVLYDIPLHNIKYGYIDIPKQSFGTPIILSNGTISRAKSQNVSQEMYEKAVLAIHGDDPKYNCEPGGYYYDCWCAMALNKAAYLSMQWLDMEVVENVTDDLFDTARMIDSMQKLKMPYLRKYDAYSCKGCEYLEACKPYLTVGDKNE